MSRVKKIRDKLREDNAKLVDSKKALVLHEHMPWIRSQFINDRGCLFDDEPKWRIELVKDEVSRVLGYWGVEHKWIDRGFAYELEFK
ncbi:hypothetical protein [Vibrio phage VCPH]|nr:hypothetical protein [Vibrio phage VCPH]